MTKKVGNEEVVEAIDFSGFAGEDDILDSTQGLNFGNALEIESLEDINKSVEDINKSKTAKEDVEIEEEEQTDTEDEEPTKSKAKPKKEVEEKVTPTIGAEDEAGDSPLKVFAEFLGEKGIINFDPEKFEDTEEYLIERVTEQIKNGIEEYKESFTPEAREIIDAIEAGIPADAILQRNSAIDTYESLTDEEIDDNEALQKSLVRNLYTMNGYSKEVIEKKIKRLDDAGLLAEEAKEAKGELVEAVKAQKEQLKAEQAKAEAEKVTKFKQWQEGIKDTLAKKEELVPGMKMTEAQKKAIHDGLTKFDKEGKNELQRMIDKDPEFNLKVAYLAIALKWDFSTFDKKAMTTQVKKLRDSIENSDKMRGSGTGLDSPKSNVDFSVMKKALNRK